MTLQIYQYFKCITYVSSDMEAGSHI